MLTCELQNKQAENRALLLRTSADRYTNFGNSRANVRTPLVLVQLLSRPKLRLPPYGRVLVAAIYFGLGRGVVVHRRLLRSMICKTILWPSHCNQMHSLHLAYLR